MLEQNLTFRLNCLSKESERRSSMRHPSRCIIIIIIIIIWERAV